MLASGALILAAYLLGSLPLVYLLVRLKGIEMSPQADLHEVLRRRSHLLGVLGFLADVAKGLIAVLVGRGLGFPDAVVAASGLVVVLGQMWPLYLLASGGKGNSTGLGVALALAPYPCLIALVPMFSGLVWRIISHVRQGQPALGPPPSRSLPLGVAIGLVILPLASWIWGQPMVITLAFTGLLVAILMRRATAGSEASEAVSSHRRRLLLHLLYD